MQYVDAEKCGSLNLGYEGEQNRKAIRFFVGDMLAEYPGGLLVLQVSRPGENAKHDVELTIDGDIATWIVGGYDLAKKGEGECQLKYSQGTAICKKKTWKTWIDESMEGQNASIPPTWQDAEDRLLTAAGAVQAAVESYDEMTATATQLPEGSAPTAEMDHSGDAPVLKLGIPKGDTGHPGQDGVSPTVTVTDITGGHRITVTDANGSRYFDVMDGEDGEPGQPGQDGVSPTLTVTNITGGHRITITDKNGTQTVDVMNGDKGDPGQDADPTTLIDDTAGTGDVKKVWSADKSASEVGALNNAISELGKLNPDATSSDIGKFLKVKTVADGKVTEYMFGSAYDGGGMSETAATLLMTILKASVYTSDQSANIASLEAELIGGDVTVTQEGSTLVFTGVTAITSITQSGSTLICA